MAAEIVDGLTQQAVGGDGDIVAVQAVGHKGTHNRPNYQMMTRKNGCGIVHFLTAKRKAPKNEELKKSICIIM